MPINSKIGIFTKYSLNYLKNFIDKNYGLSLKNFSLNYTAMDNTVIEADGKWIVKIYETKSFEYVKRSLKLFNQYREFYAIFPIFNKKGEYISQFSGKALIVYKKVEGKFIGKYMATINLLSHFHKMGFKFEKCIDEYTLIKTEQKRIQSYLTPVVITGLERSKRYMKYIDLLRRLNVLGIHKKIIISKGIIHGDAAPQNIIKTSDGTYFIDFDSITIGYQLYDIIDFFIKKSERYSMISEKKLLKYYIQKFGGSFTLGDFYDIINLLAGYRCLTIALSTEFYCYEKKKFSECTLNKLFKLRIEHLLKNCEQRLKIMEIE